MGKEEKKLSEDGGMRRDKREEKRERERVIFMIGLCFIVYLL